MNFKSTRTFYAVDILEVISRTDADGFTYPDHAADWPVVATLAGYDTPEAAEDDAGASYPYDDYHFNSPYPYVAEVEYQSTIGRQGSGGQATYTPEQMQAIYEDSEQEQSGHAALAHEIIYEVVDDPHLDHYAPGTPLFYRYDSTWYEIPACFSTMSLELVDETIN